MRLARLAAALTVSTTAANIARSLRGLYFMSNPRYSTTDHWIQESIKRIFNSGLFWPVGAAETKKMQTAISTFEASFLCFQVLFFSKVL